MKRWPANSPILLFTAVLRETGAGAWGWEFIGWESIQACEEEENDLHLWHKRCCAPFARRLGIVMGTTTTMSVPTNRKAGGTRAALW